MADLIRFATLICDCNPFANRCCEAFQNFVMERTVKHLAYVYNLEDNLEKLDSTFGQLTTLKDRVMDRVRQAEQQDMQRKRAVEVWFQDVASCRAEGIVLLNERDRQCQKLCLGGSCSTDYCSTSAFGRKVANCLEKLPALITTGGKFEQDGVAEQPRWFLPTSHLRSETARHLPVGLEAKREEVVSYLEEGDSVGVFGKVGVGKTTFLKLLKDHYDLLTDFHVIWIEQLNDSNEETIRQAIRKKIGLLNDWRCETVEEKASHISEELQKKRFILLLDGIMRSINLQNIGVPNRCDLNGSKVVFTTRNMDVCDRVEPRPEKTVSIEILEDSEALQLLRNAAGLQDTTTNSEILDRATTVAKMCGGLPHALVTIGEAMRRNTSHEDWTHTINFFQNPARDSTMGNVLFSKLRCSYDNLQEDIHKACFLYCALLPAEREIPKAQLKELWIFGDFWIDSEDYESDGTLARRILRTLIDANLLEDRREGVKIHNVFRSMALWLLATQDTLLVTRRQSEDLKAENFEGMKRVLLMDTDIDKLPKVPAYPCRNLMTLFLTSNKYLRKISPGFFRFMAELTLLDLSHSSLEELPTDISGLVSLKYLDISFTKIKELPSTLKKLVKLKYFNVNGLKLEFKSAKEVMSNLSCLKVLKMICSYSYGRGTEQNDEVELLRLNNLENVNVLEIAVGSSPALTFLLNTRKLLKKTRRLRLRGFEVSECVDVYVSEHTEKLVELSLIDCDFEELSINLKRSATEQIYCNITRVAVVKCDSLLDLTCLVLLPYLQVLEVSNCLNLGDIISEEKFRRIEEENEIQNPFQNLTTLHLKSLRELRRISSNNIPFNSLNQLRVERCHNLTKLPLIYREVDEDKIQLHAAQDWWDAIEWEDQDAEHAFSLRIIPTERRFVAR